MLVVIITLKLIEYYEKKEITFQTYSLDTKVVLLGDFFRPSGDRGIRLHCAWPGQTTEVEALCTHEHTH